MRSRCLFCHASLGRNELAQDCGVGRRVAFDPGRGRLWSICSRCQQWNLAPLENRWEIIQRCEEAYRATRLRLGTGQIGLARIGDGVELVRIGNPLRPEFAAWRYGDHIGRRRARLLGLASAASGVVASLAMGGVVALGSAGAAAVGWGLGDLVVRPRARRLGLKRGRDVPIGHGDYVTVRHRHLSEVRVLLGGSWGESWGLEVPYTGGTGVLAGPEALRTAGVLLARINRFGARAPYVQHAVEILERHGDASTCFRWAAPRPERERYRLARLPLAIRLALEMASHEETERRVLRGELALAERQWRRAERVAAIADSLLVPAFTWDFLERHRPA